MVQISRRSIFVIISLVVAITIITTLFALNMAITPTKAADPDIQALLTTLSNNSKAYYFSVRSVDGSVYSGGNVTQIGTNYVCFKAQELNYTCLPYYTILRIDYGNK